MSMHEEDYERAAESVAGGIATAQTGVMAWFRAHPNVGLVLAGLLAGVFVTLLFTCSKG